MSFLRKLFIGNDKKEPKMSSEEKDLYSELKEAAKETNIGNEIYRIIAVHDPKLPIPCQIVLRLPYCSNVLSDVMKHLAEKEIIVLDVQICLDGILRGGWFHLKNPRHGELIKKRMTSEQYYDALFWSLKGIDEEIKFRSATTQILQMLNVHNIAFPQAIHVWKQAVHYDFLIQHFWEVPLDIMYYMGTSKSYSSEEEYAPIRQLAKLTQPGFERLFPDPAPVYRRFRFLWLFYDWNDFWEAVNDDRQRFVKRKERLNYYLNFKF